jgi:hypothetical protein
MDYDAYYTTADGKDKRLPIEADSVEDALELALKMEQPGWICRGVDRYWRNPGPRYNKGIRRENMTIAEQLRNELMTMDVEKKIPFLREEVIKRIKRDGECAFIVDWHIDKIDIDGFPNRFYEPVRMWAAKEGLRCRDRFVGLNNVRYLVIDLPD